MQVKHVATATTMVALLAACGQQTVTEMTPASSPMAADWCPRDKAVDVRVVSAEKQIDTNAFTAIEDKPIKPNTRITVAAQEDLQKEWLERMVECELVAYQQGLKPSSSTDPLAVPDIEVEVYDAQGGYTIELQSRDPNAVNQAYERALALTQSGDRRWTVGFSDEPSASRTAQE